MSKKKIILVDLDHTLINTEQIKRDRDNLFLRFGFSRAEIKSARTITAKKKFRHHEALLHLLIKQRGSSNIKKDFFRAHRSLYIKKGIYNYPGIKDFLKRLSSQYTLILLTYGHPRFQVIKFKQSELDHLFYRIVVTQNLYKKKDLVKFKKQYGASVLLLDDSKEVIASAQTVGMKAIKIKKGKKGGTYYKKLFKRIKTIHR